MKLDELLALEAGDLIGGISDIDQKTTLDKDFPYTEHSSSYAVLGKTYQTLPLLSLYNSAFVEDSTEELLSCSVLEAINKYLVRNVIGKSRTLLRVTVADKQTFITKKTLRYNDIEDMYVYNNNDKSRNETQTSRWERVWSNKPLGLYLGEIILHREVSLYTDKEILIVSPKLFSAQNTGSKIWYPKTSVSIEQMHNEHLGL
jgi:hypothetical protein